MTTNVPNKALLSLCLSSKFSFTSSKLRFLGLRKPKNSLIIHILLWNKKFCIKQKKLLFGATFLFFYIIFAILQTVIFIIKSVVMKSSYSFRIFRWLSVTILGLLGFSACGDDDPAETPSAYGTPTANYIYRGTVTDEEGNPIEGIDVVFHGIVEGSMNARLVIKTDKNGVFRTGWLNTSQTRVETIDFVDRDGEANGGDFESLTLEVKDLESKKISEGSGWYQGEFEVQANVQLEKKE